ncbi:hemagglutinin repeat-containing protein [Pasteurella atlantica]|uniref:hemagglutinin repeat-containing protein n=1 Tax=Pasteurellaceae TaxID=712 RepID=UPI0027494108|nr:hemagglutinin repeat-containing protein [Pasteurella atlantica]MDP8099885.1 hemagglutinin repeat-containing protein [Pasteurella atlantica]MDP8107731.1 hemagglutinin repeat-containing protein [Pasteurella atlantica]MDP8117500.1 hemagglutinin repeat-containing protein [Pasteurella atlantica]
MNSGNSHQSSKDLKIGQFTKVSSPLIDLVNAVDEARKSKANDRVKSLQGLSVASRGYQAYDTVKNGGALVKVETGVGFKTAKSQQDSQYALSQSNKLNAGGNVSLTSTEGNIHLQNTDVSAGNLIALDSAKEILLESGQSHKKADGSNSSAGLSVGVGASVGAQTGVYVYGEAGWSQGENHLDSNTHRNTTLTSDKLSLTSKGNTTLRGATAKANRIDADIGGELTIESPQDVVKQSSEQTGVGARVQLSLGTAWEVSGNASHSEGKSNHQQVNEQSGLFAGDGGYHVTAKNVNLKGGAIASTNAKNSELITNKITFSDVQNQSESSAVSASLSGKIGENENGQDITGVSPSLPMKNGNNDSSVTKATLTEGKIILNKDTNPTQTTAKALGINTDISKANVQTETPNDVGEMLKEQSTINSAIGDVSSAVNTYTQSKQKEVAEKLKTAKTPQEVAEIKAEVESWSVGGSNKRAVDTVTTLLTTALAGKSPTEVAAATASPYLNETIHKATEGNKTANLLAHAVLSAVEFNVAGLDPATGALSGVAGEGTAMVLAEKVFNKPANQLTQKEKNILVAASTLAGTLAGATGGSVESANAGGVSAKTAVENNLLLTDYSKLKGLQKRETEKDRRILNKLKEAGVENVDDYAQQYRQCGSDTTCQKNVTQDMSKAFDNAFATIEKMAASGELSVQEVDYLSSELASDMRGAYDSKRLNQSDSKGLYHLATVNMLAKSEQKYQEARFAAQMRQWIDQGMTDTQIQDKLENEPMSIALSMAGPSLNGKQPLGGGRSIPSKTAVKGLLSSIRGRITKATPVNKNIPQSNMPVVIGKATPSTSNTLPNNTTTTLSRPITLSNGKTLPKGTVVVNNGNANKATLPDGTTVKWNGAKVSEQKIVVHKPDPSAYINEKRASKVVDEQTFLKYYAEFGRDNKPAMDGGKYIIRANAKLRDNQYITFTKDIEGLSNSQVKKKLTIESILGSKGYEQYNGTNYRVDFDINENQITVPKKSDHLNDIGGPRALGGGRQRVTKEWIELKDCSPSCIKLEDK